MEHHCEMVSDLQCRCRHPARRGVTALTSITDHSVELLPQYDCSCTRPQRIGHLRRAVQLARPLKDPLVDLIDVIQIPTPQPDAPTASRAGCHRQSPALTQRSRLQSQPVLAKIVAAISPRAAVPHRLVELAIQSSPARRQRS